MKNLLFYVSVLSLSIGSAQAINCLDLYNKCNKGHKKDVTKKKCKIFVEKDLYGANKTKTKIMKEAEQACKTTPSTGNPCEAGLDVIKTNQMCTF